MLSSLLMALSGAGILPSLPMDDPATPWLLRWDGLPGCSLPAVRPWAGEAVTACLEGLDTSMLSTTDRSQRARFLERLDLRGAKPGWGRHPQWRSGSEDRDLISLDLGLESHGSWQEHALPIARSTDSTGRDTLTRDLVGGYRILPRIELLLGPEVTLWSRLSQTTEFSDGRRWYKLFDADHGIYQTALFSKDDRVPSKARTTDWLEGALEVKLPWLRAQTGVQRLQWGAAPVASMLFSGNALPMGWTSGRKSVGPVSAEVLYGAPLGINYTENRRLYAHRTSFDLSEWIPAELTFSEAMLSNGRSFQPLYLMPVFPLLFTGHYVGTPDNLLMDFELSVRPTPKMQLVTEFFLDDLQNVAGLFKDEWGNKWGLSLGARLSELTGTGSLDRIQLTRIEPWVYTTSAMDLQGQPYTTPVHFGTLLGHPSGPNSLTLDWIHRQDLSQAWSWTLRGQGLWKGTDAGSSWRDINGDSIVDGRLVVKHPTKAWLAGDVKTGLLAGGGFEWRFASSWRLETEVTLSREDSPGSVETWPGASFRLSWRH